MDFDHQKSWILTTKSQDLTSNHQTKHYVTIKHWGFHHQHEAFDMAKSMNWPPWFCFCFTTEHRDFGWDMMTMTILWPCWVVGKTQPAAGSTIEVNIRCCSTSNQTYAECMVGSRGYQLVCRSVCHKCNITRMILPSWWYIHITNVDASDQNSAMLKVTRINHTQQELW